MVGVQTTLKDVTWLTMLSIFVEKNVIGVVLEGEDKVKFQYLTYIMIA